MSHSRRLFPALGIILQIVSVSIVGFRFRPVLYREEHSHGRKLGMDRIKPGFLYANVCLWLISGLLTLSVPTALGDERADMRHSIIIPAQEMADALATFAKQTGLQLLFPYDLVEGRKSNSLYGIYTPLEGLTRLLEGTGLTVKITGGDVITLQVQEESKAIMSSDKQKNLLFQAVAALVTMITAIDSGPAWAQSGLALEEVVVTARKRTESLQATPVAVSAFSGEHLSEIGMTELRSLSVSVPNLQLQQDAGGGSAMIACMRGLCRSDTIITEDQMVGIYVDGVANTSSFGTLFELVDIERVEVLRGPQGTLFGKNTLAGAINVVTAPPSGEYGGRAEINVGNYDLIAGRLMLDFPLTDKLYAKFAYSRRDRDGLTRNRLGEDLNSRDNQAARLALRWLPIDSLTVDYSVDWYEARQTRNPFQYTYIGSGLEAVFPGITDIASMQRLDRRAALPGEDAVDQSSHTLSVRWELGDTRWLQDVAIKSLTGHKSVSNDTSGSTSQYLLLNGETTVEMESFSQEFQLSGSALDGGMQFVSGLYYASNDGEWRNIFRFANPVPLYIQDLETKSRSWAIFGEANFDLTDRLSGFIGARYTEEERSADLMVLTADGELMTPVSAVAPEDEFTTDDFSPRLGMQYRFNDEIMSYVTLSRGFKSGGLNGRATSVANFTTYDDTVVDSVEIGVKSDLLGRRLRLNAAAFYQEVDDLQVQVNSVDPDTLNFLAQIRNAGEANMQGFELEAVLRATQHLELSASLGYIDTEYDSFITFVGADGSVVDEANNREFQFAPEWTYSLSARYERELGMTGTLMLRLDYAFVDEQFFSVDPERRIAGDDYSLIDARAELRNIGGTGFSLGVWGKNLTDEEYRIGGLSIATFGIAPNDGLGANSYGDRRTFGMDIRYEWGSAR